MANPSGKVCWDCFPIFKKGESHTELLLLSLCSAFYVPIYQSFAKSYLAKETPFWLSLRFDSAKTNAHSIRILSAELLRYASVHWYLCHATKIWFTKRLKKTNKTRSTHTHTRAYNQKSTSTSYEQIHIRAHLTTRIRRPPTSTHPLKLQLIICGVFHTFWSRSAEMEKSAEKRE